MTEAVSPRRRRAVAWRVLLPLLSFALLWLVVDVRAALARLADVSPLWLVGGLALVQVQVVLSALRWRLTAGRLDHAIPAGRAIGEYYAATWLNQVLPGGVAGDATRVLRNAGGERGASLPHVAAGVVVERLAGQVALLAVTVGGVLAWPWLLDSPPPRAGLAALAAVAAGAVLVALLLGVLARVGPARLTARLSRLAPALRRCWIDDGVWLPQGVLSLAVTASYVAMFALAASATGAPLPPAAIATVVPLTLASMLLPVSIGGWGLREAAAAATWPLAGLPAEAGVAASVLYGLLALAGSLPGLAVLARLNAARRSAASPDR